MTANAPITPPKGAHQGVFAQPSAVGRGRGWQSHSTARKATTGTKETMLASHGLVSALQEGAVHRRPPGYRSAPAHEVIG